MSYPQLHLIATNDSMVDTQTIGDEEHVESLRLYLNDKLSMEKYTSSRIAAQLQRAHKKHTQKG